MVIFLYYQTKWSVEIETECIFNIESETESDIESYSKLAAKYDNEVQNTTWQYNNLNKIESQF